MKRLLFILLVMPVLLAGCSAEKHQDDRLRVIFETGLKRLGFSYEKRMTNQS